VKLVPSTSGKFKVLDNFIAQGKESGEDATQAYDSKIAQSMASSIPSESADSKKKRPQTVNPLSKNAKMRETQIQDQSQNKILITGDDVLIEYVNRLVSGLKKLNSASSKNYDVEKVVELFIGYYVWHTPDLKRARPNATVWQRLEARLNEMRDRRKRLVKSVYK
jgi:hypothetical protein